MQQWSFVFCDWFRSWTYLLCSLKKVNASLDFVWLFVCCFCLVYGSCRYLEVKYHCCWKSKFWRIWKFWGIFLKNTELECDQFSLEEIWGWKLNLSHLILTARVSTVTLLPTFSIVNAAWQDNWGRLIAQVSAYGDRECYTKSWDLQLRTALSGRMLKKKKKTDEKNHASEEFGQ